MAETSILTRLTDWEWEVVLHEDGGFLMRVRANRWIGKATAPERVLLGVRYFRKPDALRQTIANLEALNRS